MDGDGLQGIPVGLFPLSCQGTVHAQPRQGGQMKWSEVYRLCHGFCLFEGCLRLFPLLHGLIRTPEGIEHTVEVVLRRKGPRQRDGALCDHERLFISPRFQQSKSERERTADVCPVVLALLRERECCAAPAQHAVARKPAASNTKLLLCDTSSVGWVEHHSESVQLKAPAKRSARCSVAHTVPGMLLHSPWPPQSLPQEYGSIQVRRDFLLPVPGRVLLVPGKAPALHAVRHALGPPTHRP